MSYLYLALEFSFEARCDLQYLLVVSRFGLHHDAKLAKVRDLQVGILYYSVPVAQQNTRLYVLDRQMIKLLVEQRSGLVCKSRCSIALALLRSETAAQDAHSSPKMFGQSPIAKGFPR